jgi:hypothetical protein
MSAAAGPRATTLARVSAAESRRSRARAPRALPARRFADVDAVSRRRGLARVPADARRLIARRRQPPSSRDAVTERHDAVTYAFDADADADADAADDDEAYLSEDDEARLSAAAASFAWAHDAPSKKPGASSSEPWVPFTLPPEHASCFEVVLDVSRGMDATGISFAPGPDGRPRVDDVAPEGNAHGEVESGDVLLETSAVLETASSSSSSSDADALERGGGAAPSGGTALVVGWRDTKDLGYRGAMAAVRTNAARGELAMRLCRNYEPVTDHLSTERDRRGEGGGARAGGGRGGRDGGARDAEGEKRIDDGESEWNEEAVADAKEWAARNAAAMW